MPFIDGARTAIPTALDALPKGFSTVSDSDAAERLLNRVSRQIAEMLEVGDKEYAEDLIQIYRWLGAVIKEEADMGNPITEKEQCHD